LAGLGTSPGDLQKHATNVDVVSGGQQQVGANQNAWRAALLQQKQLELGVAQSEQQRKDAVQGLADAQNNQSKQQQNANLFAKEGPKAYAPYAQAITATTQAQLA